MKEKIITTVLVIMAVTIFTTAVINFMQGNVVSGVSDVLVACSDVIIAWVLMRQKFCMKALQMIGKNLLDLIKVLENGVPATLTVKGGKGTITLGHDDDEDDGNEIPEEKLTEDEKRIKRMAEEYDQLTGRYERLTNFLASDKFKTLSEKSRTLLEQQRNAMGEYKEVLKRRIQLECDTANKTTADVR